MKTRAELAGRAWVGLRTLVFERNDRRRAVSDALGMSFIRTKALRHLVDGPLTLRALADELVTDAPYTTVVVDHLERDGLVERMPHPHDRRAKLVALTATGRAAAARADAILAEPPAALMVLDRAELAELDRIVTKLLDAHL